MWSLRKSSGPSLRTTILTAAAGALGGFALGVVLARRASGRLGTGRLARTLGEETELTRLEDAVLDAFLNHDVLSERGIEVGAIRRGIVELTGSVWTEDEADVAVAVANGVEGVYAIVNRLEVESEAQQFERTRRGFEAGDPALTSVRVEGRRVGMGRMRQGGQTEPDRPDDSQRQIERALAEADRDEWQSEDLAELRPRRSVRVGGERPDQPLDYSGDELDHQDPRRSRRVARDPDRDVADLNAGSRVGEGLKPGTELGLEQADVPLERRLEDDERG